MNESAADMVFSNEPAITDEPQEAVVSSEEQPTFTITNGLRELAVRFLDTQSPNSNGLTIDYVKSIRFEDLLLHLRKQEVIAVTQGMVGSIQLVIRSLRHADLATLDTSERQYLNVRVIMAGYMVGFHPNKVFDSMGFVENQLVESSTRFVTKLESIANFLRTNETINVDVIDDFYRLLKTYLRDFKAWKEPDVIVLTSRIIHALKALYISLARLPNTNSEASGDEGSEADEEEDEVDEADEVEGGDTNENLTQMEMENTITRLRARLVHLKKQELLDELDAWRETSLQSQIHDTSIPSQFNTSEELLGFAARVGREGVGFNSNIAAANEQIAHELLIDASFQIADDGSIGGKIFAINRAFTDAFWVATLEDLKKPESCYTLVFQVFGDILNGIHDIVGSMSALGGEAKEVLNVDHIQAYRLLDDWSSCMDLFDNIYKLVCRVQMQKREEEFKEKWHLLQNTLQSASEIPGSQPDAICATLKFFWDCIKIMLIDHSNSRIVLISEVIRKNGVKYEQDKLQTRLDNGTLTLDKTFDWLKVEVDKITIRQLRELLNGDVDTFNYVHRSALVNLIVKPATDWSDIDVIPEVLHLDSSRIEYFSEQYQKFVNCATVMRIISDFTFQVQDLQTEDGQDEIETKSAVLTSISKIVLESNPKNVEDIGHLIDIVIDKTPLGGLVCDERMEAMCKEMEAALSDPYHATRTTVSKRIVDYWKQFDVQQADTEPLHSVYLIATAITNDARSLSALAALNIKIHLPVFKRIILGVVQSLTNGMTVSADVSAVPAASSENSGVGVLSDTDKVNASAVVVDAVSTTDVESL